MIYKICQNQIIFEDVGFDHNNCFKNVIDYCRLISRTKPLITYKVKEFNDKWILVEHAILQLESTYIDITPGEYYDFLIIKKDQAFSEKQEIYKYNTINHSLACINIKEQMQEKEIMYYIYALIDPRNDKPFYVGKGRGNRWKDHFRSVNNPSYKINKRKDKRIEEILTEGNLPYVRYLIEDIENEDEAYDLEKFYVDFLYGKEGIDIGGILTNINKGGKHPPNHKGKTYAEIYGPVEGERQRLKRAQLQKERGGYGPRVHTEENRRKMREGIKNSVKSQAHLHRPRNEELRRKISEANKGKFRLQTTQFKFISPDGIEYFINNRKERDLLYKQYNLSHSTFEAAERQKWSAIKTGKNAGWKRERVEKTDESA